MSVGESPGNVIIKPLKEYTVFQSRPESQKLNGVNLWGELFKTISDEEVWKASKKLSQTEETDTEEQISQCLKVHEIKPKFNVCNAELENNCLTVKRNSTLNFEIELDCQWQKLDTLKLVFMTEENCQKDKIVEEFRLSSIGDNLIEVVPSFPSTWFLSVVKAEGHKIDVTIYSPNCALLGKWNIILSLSLQRTNIHNFLLCYLEVV